MLIQFLYFLFNIWVDIGNISKQGWGGRRQGSRWRGLGEKGMGNEKEREEKEERVIVGKGERA